MKLTHVLAFSVLVCGLSVCQSASGQQAAASPAAGMQPVHSPTGVKSVESAMNPDGNRAVEEHMNPDGAKELHEVTNHKAVKSLEEVTKDATVDVNELTVD